MNDNLVTIEVNGKVIFAGKADLQFSLNQKVREPLHITKGKGKLMEALTESFIKGGINSMENRPIEELQETIKEYLTFEYQRKGIATEPNKRSFLSELKKYARAFRKSEMKANNRLLKSCKSPFLKYFYRISLFKTYYRTLPRVKKSPTITH